MTEVTAYHNPNAPVHRQWIAYVVMDNGNLWGVYATGATEEATKTKIQILWESERQKVARKPTFNNPWASEPASLPDQPETSNRASVNPRASQQQHGSVGLKWLIHKINRTKCRVNAVVAESMVSSGDWEYGGPKSK